VNPPASNAKDRSQAGSGPGFARGGGQPSHEHSPRCRQNMPPFTLRTGRRDFETRRAAGRPKNFLRGGLSWQTEPRPRRSNGMGNRKSRQEGEYGDGRRPPPVFPFRLLVGDWRLDYAAASKAGSALPPKINQPSADHVQPRYTRRWIWLSRQKTTTALTEHNRSTRLLRKSSGGVS